MRLTQARACFSFPLRLYSYMLLQGTGSPHLFAFALFLGRGDVPGGCKGLSRLESLRYARPFFVSFSFSFFLSFFCAIRPSARSCSCFATKGADGVPGYDACHLFRFSSIPFQVLECSFSIQVFAIHRVYFLLLPFLLSFFGYRCSHDCCRPRIARRTCPRLRCQSWHAGVLVLSLPMFAPFLSSQHVSF